MNDKEFDNLLESEISENSLDNEMVKGITPWRRNMEYVVIGLFFSIVSFSDVGTIISHLIMFFAGIMLIVGFRGLQKENKWFFAGYIGSIIKLIIYTVIIINEATIWKDNFLSRLISENGVYLNILSVLVITVCLWRSIRAVEKKAQVTKGSKSPVILIAWYLVAIIMAIYNITSMWVTGFMIMYVAVFVCMIKVYKSLDKAGYAIEPCTIKVSNKLIVVGAVIVLSISLVWVYSDNMYTMDWSEFNQGETTEVNEVREHLASLGVPEMVLNDMTKDDILACTDAVKIIIEEEDFPMNEGYEVQEEVAPNSYMIYTKYDAYEIHMTSIALCLNESENRWKMIHHFRTNEDPGFYCTEAFILSGDELAKIDGEITGHLVCDIDGKTYVAPYYSMKRDAYYFNIMGSYMGQNAIYTEFSFDRKADGYGGYISYELTGNDPEILITVQTEFLHQNDRVNFPAKTMLDMLENYSMFNKDRDYVKTYHGIQFRPSEGK